MTGTMATMVASARVSDVTVGHEEMEARRRGQAKFRYSCQAMAGTPLTSPGPLSRSADGLDAVLAIRGIDGDCSWAEGSASWKAKSH